MASDQISNDVAQNYTRVAKNTLFLYLRMLFTMGISFYTTRLVLEALGVDDYGIYNVLGGVVALCSILTGSLTISISRFVALELGKGNIEKVKAIFNTSLLLMICVAIIMGLIAEGFGYWFVNYKMTIPPEKIRTAIYAMQCFIFSFMVGLVWAPFSAVIVAHEKIAAFAYLTIISKLLALSIAFILFLFDSKRLIIYAILTLASHIFMQMIYYYYCRRNFDECRIQRKLKKDLIKEMSKFTGCAFLGNAAYSINQQGTNLALNVYCGLAVNAARGIAGQIFGALEALVNNLMAAVNPQITKSYGNQQIAYTQSLICKSAKFGFFILLVFAYPICICVKPILTLWLVEIPEYVEPFILLSIVASLIQCLNTPVLTLVLARGKLRTYELIITAEYLLAFMSTLLFLSIGFSAIAAYVILIVLKMCLGMTLIIFARRDAGFNLRQYFVQSIIPIIKCCVSLVLPYIILSYLISGLLIKNIAIFLVSFIISAFVIFFIGCNKSERYFFKQKIGQIRYKAIPTLKV